MLSRTFSRTDIRIMNSKICFKALVSLLAAVTTLCTSARAAELASATLPDTLKAGDTTLKLNGLGIRKKSIVKVYVGALYLTSPSKDPDAIVASDQAKAVRMHFLRDLKKTQVTEGLREGFDAN